MALRKISGPVERSFYSGGELIITPAISCWPYISSPLSANECICIQTFNNCLLFPVLTVLWFFKRTEIRVEKPIPFFQRVNKNVLNSIQIIEKKNAISFYHFHYKVHENFYFSINYFD